MGERAGGDDDRQDPALAADKAGIIAAPPDPFDRPQPAARRHPVADRQFLDRPLTQLRQDQRAAAVTRVVPGNIDAGAAIRVQMRGLDEIVDERFGIAARVVTDPGYSVAGGAAEQHCVDAMATGDRADICQNRGSVRDVELQIAFWEVRRGATVGNAVDGPRRIGGAGDEIGTTGIRAGGRADRL